MFMYFASVHKPLQHNKIEYIYDYYLILITCTECNQPMLHCSVIALYGRQMEPAKGRIDNWLTSKKIFFGIAYNLPTLTLRSTRQS